MKTRIKVIITVSLLCLFALLIFLSNCKVNNFLNKKNGRFVEIQEESGTIGDCHYKIVYDTTTRVMYYVSDSVYNHGNLCPLYNADGSIMTYDYVESEE